MGDRLRACIPSRYVTSQLGQHSFASQIAVATLSGSSLRQTVHTHHASVHQAAKLVAALLRVARVTAGLAASNGSLPLADCKEPGSAPEPSAPESSTLTTRLPSHAAFAYMRSRSTVQLHVAMNSMARFCTKNAVDRAPARLPWQ